MEHDQNKEYDGKPQDITFPELMFLFCDNVLAVGNAISAIRCNCFFYFTLFYYFFGELHLLIVFTREMRYHLCISFFLEPFSAVS